MPTVTVSIAEFIKANRITMTAHRVDTNPNMPDANMDHWKVTLRRPGHAMTTYFSMGIGHNGKEPTAADLLDCLASDALDTENGISFEEWAEEFGYSVDSRKAEKTYKTCQHLTKRLQNFLGPDAFNQLIWHTERM